MKKSIGVIALDPFAGRAYAEQVRQVFGERAVVRNYSIMDNTAAHIEPCDLCMASTDAFSAMEDPDAVFPEGAQRMEIQVTYRKEVISRLRRIPEGTEVLFVNMTETMAREAVTQLEQLGVSHLKFILYAPGETAVRLPGIAVTPDEERYVPEETEEIINIGQRTCSADTMIEAAVRLGLEELLEEAAFKEYQESVCTNTYCFDRMMARSHRLETQFDILMEVLDQGVIAVDECGEIYAVNERAEDITHVPGESAAGRKGEEVFPYIPFSDCLERMEETEPLVVRAAGSLVSVCVRPVIRRGRCVGAFAILQKFNEIERRQSELRGQLMKKGQGRRAKYCFDDIIGQSEAIRRTKEILKKMALTESPVLLTGETGTGKELFAHSIHNASRRREHPFIVLNCGAVPDSLLESELFGYEEGAFTGAKKGGKPGLFEFAHQGTLFLDEVEGMSPALQVKLLRVLQEGEVMRVGGSRMIHVDVRIVTATNEELDRRVEEGRFRRDLYYRLNALPVFLPPLRERGEDMFLLLDKFRRELGGRFELGGEIKELFRSYRWPGNVRELRNAAEYLNFTGQRVITERELPPALCAESRLKAGGKERAGESGWRKEADEKGESAVTAGAGAKGADGKGQGDAPYASQVILELLYRAREEGRSIGRERIILEGRLAGWSFTQPQVRRLLRLLEQEGYAEVLKGRGGSVITEAGAGLIKSMKKYAVLQGRQ